MMADSILSELSASKWFAKGEQGTVFHYFSQFNKGFRALISNKENERGFFSFRIQWWTLMAKDILQVKKIKLF